MPPAGCPTITGMDAKAIRRAAYHIAVGDLRAVSAGAGAAGLAAMASA